MEQYGKTFEDLKSKMLLFGNTQPFVEEIIDA